MKMSNNRNVTRQTTLFPDEIFHGILDEKCHIEFRDHPRYLMESYYDLLESDIEDSTLKAELKNDQQRARLSLSLSNPHRNT